MHFPIQVVGPVTLNRTAFIFILIRHGLHKFHQIRILDVRLRQFPDHLSRFRIHLPLEAEVDRSDIAPPFLNPHPEQKCSWITVPFSGQET